MASSCSITGGAGDSKGYEMATQSTIKGELQGVESDLPDDLKQEAVLAFQAAVSDHKTVAEAITKVQNQVLSKVNDIFKGKRYKAFIKFDYDTNVVNISINKFANGNAQFASGIGTRKAYCPDPFMGRLHDPNMNKK